MQVAPIGKAVAIAIALWSICTRCFKGHKLWVWNEVVNMYNVHAGLGKNSFRHIYLNLRDRYNSESMFSTRSSSLSSYDHSIQNVSCDHNWQDEQNCWFFVLWLSLVYILLWWCLCYLLITLLAIIILIHIVLCSHFSNIDNHRRWLKHVQCSYDDIENNLHAYCWRCIHYI